MKIVKIVFRLMMILLLFSFFMCTPNTKNSPNVRISVPASVSSLPVSLLNNTIVAEKSIQITYFQDHSMTMAEFITGKIDILMTGYSQGAAVAETNSEVTHLATIVWGTSSLVTWDNTIRELKDLSGRSISVPFAGSPLDLQIKALLKKSGLSDTITLEYHPIQQAAALLIQKKVIAACVPEPLTTILVHEKGLFSPFTIPDAWENLFGYKNTPQVSLFAKKIFINTHKKFINSFLVSLTKNIISIPALNTEQKTRFAGEIATPADFMETALSKTIFALYTSDQELLFINNYLKDIEMTNNTSKDFFYTHE